MRSQSVLHAHPREVNIATVTTTTDGEIEPVKEHVDREPGGADDDESRPYTAATEELRRCAVVHRYCCVFLLLI